MNAIVQNQEDLIDFAAKLKVLKTGNFNSIFFEMLPLAGAGTAIAFSRFLTLQKKVLYGSIALFNAFKIDHQGIICSNIDDSYFFRSMYFENAVEAYNKVIDYVYVIVYFNFNLFEIIDNDKICNNESVFFLSEKIKGKKLSQINEWLAQNEHTDDFAALFNKYREETNDLRKLANDMKHRGCIAVEGTSLQRNTAVLININGVKVNISEIIKERIINLDLEIEKLVAVHQMTVELQQSLYELCNFGGKFNKFMSDHVNIKNV